MCTGVVLALPSAHLSALPSVTPSETRSAMP
jgi:hypothetical protein